MSGGAVTAEGFEREVLDSGRPVIVDFWAPWCGPCRRVARVLDEIAVERAGEVKVVKINVDDEPELAARFGISSIPTIILFVDGSPVAGTVGSQGKTQLERSLGLSPPTSASGAPSTGRFSRLISRASPHRSYRAGQGS